MRTSERAQSHHRTGAPDAVLGFPAAPLHAPVRARAAASTTASSVRDHANDAAAGYDVAIVGGGIIGASILYVLSHYTNVSRIILLEKYPDFGTVTSRVSNNSQTLHFGDIETNYGLEKAVKVKEAAELLGGYLLRYGEGMYTKRSKMVLGVGEREVRELEQRYEEFREAYPKFRKLSREEIAAREPNVVAGRDPRVPLIALQTDDGYAVNYEKVTRSFIDRARAVSERSAGKREIAIHGGVEVVKVLRADGRYVLVTTMGDISARVVVFATGPYSLAFAKSLGLAKDWGLLPVAGNFYLARQALNGKVYMMQIPGVPFAAVHGDPNVVDSAETRFGPTIRVLPLLERHHYGTLLQFLRTAVVWTPRGLWAFIKVTLDPNVFRNTVNNFLYGLPLVGTWFFVRREIRKIVPAIRPADVKLIRGAGGIRPVVVDTKKAQMDFGTAEIDGNNIIFFITPSPGATICLKNAESATEKIMGFLGGGCEFDQKRFRADHSWPA